MIFKLLNLLSCKWFSSFVTSFLNFFSIDFLLNVTIIAFSEFGFFTNPEEQNLLKS
jgi:hypothetical protein